ncbi:Crp/Fnr family transcriptional regulator [Pedobacter montanisoli]|uniref:Crp/Fnr family transcriptional regulator n=1 Tax=Pedobacter montanisoli TaxID=2923277 RepID=A0ABS9ZWM4_9SPHI|nr:Crp/Fnr family transcriptional regulator [Pedobacter montanisoli]MCJ0742696.1 Crp/Fnr family transcriptional regulator [Pedobacter montanisoli]
MSRKLMLRTNSNFLAYAEQLYNQQANKADIILKSFAKGERLLTQHEKPTKIMLIKEGITKCFFTETNDKEFIVEFLGKGEITGEIELIRGGNCLCSIEALTDVSVYAFSLPFFNELLKKDLALNHLLLKAFAGRIIDTASRASYQQLHTTEHSLAKLLELQSKQDMAISKEDMAAYLGISLRNLNRALKKL